ncbi:hypothetical protein CHRYSEO8AT_560098 [Chryseobacterium sp. 8AT]|nr:hypothetical protein CHRYSEO8AT_560098 [Chryseobacterium sp. 8AT]
MSGFTKMLILIYSDKIFQLLNVHLINIIYDKDITFLAEAIKNSTKFDSEKWNESQIITIWIIKN